MTQAVDLMLRREAGGRRLARELTPREIEIVGMVGEGLRNKEIALRMTLTEGTAKVHLHNIYTKLELDGRLQLMKYARTQGLV